MASSILSEEEAARLKQLHFSDTGHGYDPFGMHPSFVSFGVGITSPIYNRYHRVKSYDAHLIPTSGPAILAANHSGNYPMDAAMLWLDVLKHTNPPRVARPVA